MKTKNSKIKEEVKNRKKKEPGFTLVELIVVITILAILSTIAFISFTGYSQNSRDSKRIADINSIQKSLELYITEKGTYPIPDNNASITYSGAIAWIEGTVGDGVMINMKNINKKPLDPLTENEYTYSVTTSKTEYQIGSISESGQMGYELPINQTYAVTEKKGTAMIRGTYNERFLKVQSGTINRILALPSIIATDITQTEVQAILDSKKLVYNNYNNIPHSYNNAGYIMDGGFDYTNTTPQVYSGSMKTLTDSNDEKKIFISGLKSAYNGTILQGEANYKDIINSDIATNSTGAINTVISFINSNIGGIRVSNTTLSMLPDSGTSIPPVYSCAAEPEYEHADFTAIGTPTQVNQERQNDNISNPCYYVCKDSYTGEFCNIAPIVYPSGTNIITDQYLTALDNSDSHISPDYNIGNNQIYISNPIKDADRDYDHILYNYGFWGINTATSKSIIFKLNQSRIISYMKIGFANSTNMPTGCNIYSLSGTTWNHIYGSSLSTTYTELNLSLPAASSSIAWKIDFIGGTTPYYVDTSSFQIKLQ